MKPTLELFDHDDPDFGMWTSVTFGRDNIGSFLNRDDGVEAYDADEFRIGVFADEDAACSAISGRWDVKPKAASCENPSKAPNSTENTVTGSPPPSPEGIVDNPLTIARGYLKRGWNPVPVSCQTKKPIGNGWQHRRLTEKTAAKVFNRADMNVGVQLGPMSNGLTDVDLDCREAVMIGAMLLPASNNIFGRASKPQSHWLYGTTLADKITKAHLQFKDTDGTMMLELKIGGGGKGSQSVFPGSTHTSGETIEWGQDGALVCVDDDELLRQVRRLAVTVMLARHWPADGSRHDAALTVGGFLARAGFDENEVALMLEAIATAAEDEQGEDRVKAGRDAVKQYGNGGETRGLPALVEAFDEKIALKAAQWLNYSTSLLRGAKDLPELVVNGSDPTATAKDLALLIAKRDDFLFNGNRPVRIAAEAGCVPRALAATIEMVRVLAHEICIPTKLTIAGAEHIPIPLSNDIAKLYLHGLEGCWGLKPFHGITTSPILSGDGVIRAASGYDACSGLWCHNIPAVIVPAQPTRDNAEQALRRLRRVFRTFPFADAARVHDPKLGVEVVNLEEGLRAGLDESIFLTALMTAVCRQSLELAPGCLCDAPNISGAGTGKGLLARAMCIVASGVRPAAFTSGHDAQEFDKRLTSALVQARPAVFLDNYNSKVLTSEILASALTESPAMVRLFGQTKTVPLHVRTFIVISGNAVEIAEDMARRLLDIHIDARMENPEQRPFQPGFLDRIFTERASLLTDALTIWRWGRQTKLTPGKPLGSYEIWAQWCRDPLIALGMRDPVDRIAEIKAADPKRRMLIAIFDRWWDIHRDQLVKAHELGHEIASLIPGAVNRDGTVVRQKVAGFCAENTGTRVGGYVLTRLPLTKKVTGYKLERPMAWSA